MVVRLSLKDVSIRRIVNIAAAVAVTRETLRGQRIRRFRTQGASDGPGLRWAPHRHDSSRSVLTDRGHLRDLVEFSVQERQAGFRIEMRQQRGLELIANVHQQGTKPGKDIVPKQAKALFIPLTGIAQRSEKSGPVRVGVRGNRRGRARRQVSLSPGTDFLLRKRIKATPEKEGRAIQPRPHWRISELNRREIIENLESSQR